MPVIATRIGWKTSRGLTSSSSTTPRSASSTCSAAERLGSRLEGAACGAQPLGRPVRHHLRPRLLVVVRRALDEEARQLPEVGERLHLLLADRDRCRRHLAAAQRLEPGAQVLGRQVAQVAAVHPAQLLLVEHGRVLRHPRQVEALDQLARRHEGGRLVVAPAEQRHVVAHRLGQVAGVAQLLHRRGAVALRELLAVGPVQQRQVREQRRRRRRARAGSSPGAACSRCGRRRGRRA